MPPILGSKQIRVGLLGGVKRVEEKIEHCVLVGASSFKDEMRSEVSPMSFISFQIRATEVQDRKIALATSN
jgi:hypothetical protein